jgi:hypothetical protein
MGKLTTALKWFAYGIGLGLLFAPRSGKETRQQVAQTVSGYVTQALNTGSGMMGQGGSRSQQAGSQTQSSPYASSPTGATTTTGPAASTTGATGTTGTTSTTGGTL